MTAEQTSRKEKIRFLVSLRFPRLFDSSGALSKRLSSDLHLVERGQAREYVAILENLSDTQLGDRYDKAIDWLRAEADAQELARPFNKLIARADVSRWAKMAYWTPDEAVALSLGIDPQFVKWELVKKLTHVSPTAFKYAAQREIVMRAKATGQLGDRSAPSDFLAWAELMEFPVPENLTAAVKALNRSAVDWKALFDQSQLKVEALSKRIEELEREKSRAEAERLGTRERESLLKLVIGMAVGKYDFDPMTGRRGIAKVIAHDLASAGLPMDEDTVRKYLAAGKERLPRN